MSQKVLSMFTELAQSYPKANAIIYDEIETTFEDLESIVRGIEHLLEPYDRIALHLPASDAIVAFFLACWESGKEIQIVDHLKNDLTGVHNDIQCVITNRVDITLPIGARSIIVKNDIIEYKAEILNNKNLVRDEKCLDDSFAFTLGNDVQMRMDQLWRRLSWEWCQYVYYPSDISCTLHQPTQPEFWVSLFSALLKGTPTTLPSTETRVNVIEFTQFVPNQGVTHLFMSAVSLCSLATFLKVSTPLVKHTFLKTVKRITCVNDNLPLRATYQDITSSFSGVDTEIVFMLVNRAACDVASYGLPESQRCVPIDGCRAIVLQNELNLITNEITYKTGLSGNGSGDYVFYSDSVWPFDELLKVKKTLIEIVGHECCEVFRDTYKGGLIAFYRYEGEACDWPRVLRHAMRRLQVAEVPKLFPVVNEEFAPTQFMEDYRDAVAKIAEFGLPPLEASKILFVLAYRLETPLNDFEMDKPLSDFGANENNCALISSDMEQLGMVGTYVSPGYTVLDVVRMTTPLRTINGRTFSTKIIDQGICEDTVCHLLGECFASKNRLDLAVKNTPDQHVNMLNQMWDDILQAGMSRVAFDVETGDIVAAMISLDLSFEMELEGLSEAFEVIMELHEQYERQLKEVFKDTRIAVCCFIGTSLTLTHEENLTVIKQLLDELYCQALATKGSPIQAILSMNSHLVTRVMCENYLDCDVIGVIDVRAFEYRGRRPFAAIPRETEVCVALRYIR